MKEEPLTISFAKNVNVTFIVFIVSFIVNVSYLILIKEALAKRIKKFELF